MRTFVVASALLLTALWATGAQAQSRVSIEVGGVVSAYSFGGSSPKSTYALMPHSIAGASSSDSPTSPGAGILAAEVRPTILLDDGLLFAVGFRFGQAGFGASSTDLVGADFSAGIQHRWGRFIPFVRAMFGVNGYDDYLSPSRHHTDLLLDAVVGGRFYLSQRLFVSASAFAGWGQQYGGALDLGGDIVQVIRGQHHYYQY